MDKIKSFEINHDEHHIGLYMSHQEYSIYTYDMRFKTPNGGDYLDSAVMHTIEHILATCYRNSEYREQVVYFGPMGCRTGFYLLMRELDIDKVLPLTITMLNQAIHFDTIPGSTKAECGNYLEHDLEGAIREMKEYLSNLTK